MTLLLALGVACVVLWLVLRQPKSVRDAFARLEAVEKQLADEAKANATKKDGV